MMRRSPRYTMNSLRSLISARSLRSLSPRTFLSHSTAFSAFSTAREKPSHSLYQFSPPPSSDSSLAYLTWRESRTLLLSLAETIKRGDGHLLKTFSLVFCPLSLVEIMKQLDRGVAFSFFKLVHRDEQHYGGIVLGLEKHNRYLSQDVLSWIFKGMTDRQCSELAAFLWDSDQRCVTDFYILDTLMRSFTNAEMPVQALGIFHKLWSLGRKPSGTAVTLLLKLLVTEDFLEKMWSVFRILLLKGPKPVVATVNPMIHGFFRKGHVTTALSLFHIMPKFNLVPNVDTYNILINGYCLQGSVACARRWYNAMLEKGVKPCDVTFSTLLNALCMQGDMENARKLFDDIEDMGLRQTVACYNCMFDGYVKDLRLDEANTLYEEMKKKKIHGDGMTINILVGGNNKHGRRLDGEKILSEYLLSYSTENGEYCGYVSALCLAGKVEEAMSNLKTAIESGKPPSVVAFNSIISAYLSQGSGEKVYETFELMLRHNVRPSPATYTTFVIGLSKFGEVEEGRQLIFRMREKGIIISTPLFTEVLRGFFKDKDVIGACNLWNLMPQLIVSPDVVCYSVFIDGLCKHGFVRYGHSIFFRMQMEGVLPNIIVFNSLIHAYCRLGRMKEALSLKKAMEECGLEPDTFTRHMIDWGQKKSATGK